MKFRMFLGVHGQRVAVNVDLVETIMESERNGKKCVAIQTRQKAGGQIGTVVFVQEDFDTVLSRLNIVGG